MTMLRCIIVVLIGAFIGLSVAGAADARDRNSFNPVPFSQEPCSVLDNQPCGATICSPLNKGTCIPGIEYPYGENLQVTVESKPAEKDAPKYQKPDHDLDTIGDLFAALRSCWTPPPEGSASAGMQMSVKFSFKRSG